MKNFIKNLKNKSKNLFSEKKNTSKVQQINKVNVPVEHKFSRKSDPYLDAMLEEQKFLNNEEQV